MNSIRKKVMLAMLAAVLVTEVLIMGPVDLLVGEQLHKSWTNTLSETARHGGKNVAQRLERLRSAFLAMCEDEAIRVFYVKGQYPLLQKHFDKHRDIFKAIRLVNQEDVAEFDSAADDPEALPVSLGDPPAQKALADPGVVGSSILHQARAADSVIRFFYASKSYFDEFQGLVSADVLLADIGQDLDSDAHSPIANILVDDRGNVLSLSAQDGTPLRSFDGKDALDTIATGEGGRAIWRGAVDGVPSMGFVAKVSGVDLYVVSLLPLSVMEEGRRTLRYTLAGVGGLVFILTMVFSWGLANSLSRPIIKVAETAKKISKGDFSHHLVVEGNDEISFLAQSFNQMQEQLEKLWRELQNAQCELEKRVQLRTAELSREINERKRSEELLKAATNQAESANQAKSIFLANMSHEIRTPMNGVLGMLQLAQATELTDEQKEYMDTAYQSGRKLLGIINDILDLTRVESGKFHLVLDEFDPTATLNAVVSLLATQKNRKDINFSSTIDKNIPSALVGDASRIRQILVNLIGNAMKFTEHGEVHVWMKVDPMEEKGASANLILTVSDTGIGIPRDKLESIYEPFTQVEGSVPRYFGGTGLGLSIVKRLVKLMGGEVHVESEVGTGTTFRVHIPVTIVEKDKPVPGEHAAAATASLSGLHILLAEDDLSSQLVAERMLEKLGHTVTCVATGREVLASLEKERFDLVLMDVQMPGMDGTQVVREIRNDQRFENMPVIAVTAHAMAGDRERLLEIGMDDYLAKPIDIEMLAKAVAWVMAK